MSSEELYEILELKYQQYNQEGFIEDDPISIPHSFSRKEDIEISGFHSATIAWGQHIGIINNDHKVKDMMDQAPFEYVTRASEDELSRVESFVHRTMNGQDCRAIILGLRNVYLHEG